jgi:hypothetical protein
VNHGVGERTVGAVDVGDARHGWTLERRSSSFLKKKQKTFTNFSQPSVHEGQVAAGRKVQKFFGSFFQKRTAYFDS